MILPISSDFADLMYQVNLPFQQKSQQISLFFLRGENGGETGEGASL